MLTATHPAAAVAPQKTIGAMSSPPEGRLKTKARHPPALKAGGMRTVQKHPHTGDSKEDKDKDDQGKAPVRLKQQCYLWYYCPGDKDFPPAAAQVVHQRPQVSMEHSISNSLPSDWCPDPAPQQQQLTQVTSRMLP